MPNVANEQKCELLETCNSAEEFTVALFLSLFLAETFLTSTEKQ